MKRLEIAYIALLVLVASAAGSQGAPLVVVHPTHPTCQGAGIPGVTCFNNLQDAVDNAGPPPARVRILSGTYDKVDLSTMGSAILEGQGDIELVGVGDVLISPAAGDRAICNSGGSFAGAILLDNIEVTSPDRDAIHLEGVTGDVELREVVARDAGVDGADIETDGTTTIVDSQFLRNGNDGAQIRSGGSVRIERSIANESGGAGQGDDGFNIEVFDGDVTIIDSEANDNDGEGFEIHPLTPIGGPVMSSIGKVTIRRSHARRNGVRGPVIEVDPPVPPTIMSDGFQIEDCGDGTIGDVEITDSSAYDNSQDGFELIVEGDVLIEDVIAEINGFCVSGDGIDLQTPGAVEVRRVALLGNADDGIQVDEDPQAASSIALEDVTANGNGQRIPFNCGQPFLAELVLESGQDEGIDLDSAGPVECRRCTANGNGDSGIEIKRATTVLLIDIEANGNRENGIDAQGDYESATCLNCTANRNGQDGFIVDSTELLIDGCEMRSNIDDDGIDWQPFGDNSTATIRNCLLAGNNEEGIAINDSEFSRDVVASVEISNVCVRSNRDGISFGGIVNSASVTSSQSIQNARHGFLIRDFTGGVPAISGNNISLNGTSGMAIENTAPTIDATGNWWGAASGPFDAGDNDTGAGNGLIDSSNGGLGTVNFAPFAAAPVPGASDCEPASPAPALAPAATAMAVALLVAFGFYGIVRRREATQPMTRER